VGGAYDHNNGFGVQFYGWHNTVQDASMHDNVTGGVTLNGSANVENSVFTHNGTSGHAATVWVIGPGSSLRNLTITDNGTVGLALKAEASGTTVKNVLSQGNNPNLRNDSGTRVSVNGSGATLVPGQTQTLATAPPLRGAPAETTPPLPPAVAKSDPLKATYAAFVLARRLETIVAQDCKPRASDTPTRQAICITVKEAAEQAQADYRRACERYSVAPTPVKDVGVLCPTSP